MDDTLDKQVLDNVAETVAETVVGNISNLQNEAKKTLSALKRYTKNAFNQSLSIDSFKKIFQSLKSSTSLDDDSASEVFQKIKEAQEKINTKKLEKSRQKIITKILNFQNLLNQTLGREVILTWIYNNENNEEVIMTFDEKAEAKIISQSSGSSGKVALNASSRNNVTGIKLEDYLKKLANKAGEEEIESAMESHINNVQKLHKKINEQGRLVKVGVEIEKKYKNKNGEEEVQKEKTDPLFLWWWIEATKRKYGYVNNYGFYYEGYVGALVNYQSGDFESNNLEDNIALFYKKYVSQADNLAGMWGGDVVSTFSNNDLNIQFAVKYLDASSQSFSLLYNFMEWIAAKKDLKGMSKENLYNIFYKDYKEKVGHGIVSHLLTSVQKTIATAVKEKLEENNDYEIEFQFYDNSSQT